MARTPRTRQGVILIEAVVAIGVLAVIFTSALSLFTRSLIGVRSSSDQIVATYLAQDAAEYLLAKVAANKRVGDDRWADDLDGCDDGAVCSIDTTSPISAFSLTPCVGPACDLQLDSSGKYRPNGSGSITTSFRRTVEVTLTDTNGDGANDEAYVHIVVSWESGAAGGSVPLTFTVYGYEV